MREAAEGQKFLAMAGFQTNEILNAMPGLLDLAASSNMELGRAADIASNILSAFNYEADQTTRIADVLAKGASSANTSVEQLGGAMKYVAPVASTLNHEVEGLVASIGFMSDAGVQGEQAGRQLRQGLLRLANPTGKAADLIEELGINVFDSNNDMKQMHEVVGELEKGLKGMDSQARAAALAVIFGAESVAGWSTLIDRGSQELAEYTKELENAEGSAAKMAKVMEDNAKGSLREFRSASEEVGIAIMQHVLPAVTDIIRKGTDLVRKFGDLDKSTQQNIIKMGLFAAAIGPVAIVAGSLTTTIGGLVRVGSSLAGLLGTARGAGLLGRIAMLGVSGPVGLAIAGVGLLGGAIWGLTRNKKELHDVNFDLIEQMTEEVLATDELINQFEELQRKNRLTTDEMLEYMDVLSDLESTAAPESIAELTNRKEELLEKSGLTNEEMDLFLELNDKIIQKSPEVSKAISEEGNAYVENLHALKELNEEKRRELIYTSERELEKALKNEIALMEREQQLIDEILETEEKIKQNKQDRLTNTRELNKEQEKYNRILAQINELEGENTAEANMKRLALQAQLQEQGFIVAELESERDLLEEQNDELNEKLTNKRNELETTKADLKETRNLVYEYEQLVLLQAGITSEKGKGLDTIKEQIRQLERQKRQAKDLYDRGVITSQEYQEQVSELDNQIDRLKTARGQLEYINEIAGRTIYDKQVFLSVPNLDEIEKRIGKPIAKRVTLDVNQRGAIYAPLYAEGTSFHPGGPFIAGEEGVELGKYGNRFELLPFGMYDRPQGYKVFTHEETKKILNSLNNIPAYANGARTTHDVSNLVNQNNMSNVEALLQQLIYAVKEGKNIILNGRVVGREITPYVTEEQERTNRFKGAFV